MRNTKAEILSAARRLFNERGYNAVSMRNIADALGISVGNLTYYFAKKEDLIEAAVLESHLSYKKKPPCANLEQLDAHLARILAHHAANAYYFRHYVQLAQLSERIAGMQREVMTDLRDTLARSFALFEKQGLMRPEECANQRAALIEQIMLASIFSLPGESEGVEHRRKRIWSVLFAFLTDEGKAQARALNGPAA